MKKNNRKKLIYKIVINKLLNMNKTNNSQKKIKINLLNKMNEK